MQPVNFLDAQVVPRLRYDCEIERSRELVIVAPLKPTSL
jgi:hypothetical protein